MTKIEMKIVIPDAKFLEKWSKTIIESGQKKNNISIKVSEKTKNKK